MSEDDKSKNLSTQKVLLPGHDPGWNDPPQWAISGMPSSTVTPTKRLLNKRVAFPLGSTQVTDKESTSEINPKSVNMPPPLQSPINLMTVQQPLLVPLSDKGTDVEKSNVQIDKNQALENSLATLHAVINEHKMETSKVEEIKKRLDMMKAAWVDDKLNSEIHQKVLDLSEALREKNIEKADEIHVALVVQYANLCSSWIAGIRHIILELKTKDPNSSTAQL